MFNHKIVLTAAFVSLITYASADLEGFIVNGEYAHIYDHPHMAFMAISCKKNHFVENWACGASIINQVILLSVAHCLEDCQPTSTIGISIGAENKKKGVKHIATSFLIHPDYDEEYVKNDISLIRMKVPFKFGPKVKKLALMKNPPAEEYATVSGWGLVDENKYTGTLYLKEATQRVLSHKACLRILNSMHRGTICAGYRNPTPQQGYAAEGDSGSALVIRKYIQIGIVSFKLPTISRSITVYTDVSFFYDWIRDNSKRLYCG